MIFRKAKTKFKKLKTNNLQHNQALLVSLKKVDGEIPVIVLKTVVKVL